MSDELSACGTELYPSCPWKCNHRLGAVCSCEGGYFSCNNLRERESLAHGDLTSGPPGIPWISQQNNTCRSVKIKPSSVEMVLVGVWLRKCQEKAYF